MNENSLNNKLTRLDTAMADIRNTLLLPENAPIETVCESLQKEAINHEDKLENVIRKAMREYKTWLDNSVNSYEIMYDTPITLYTPVEGNTSYVIRRTDSTTYYIMWYKLGDGYLSHSLTSYGFTKYGILNSCYILASSKVSAVSPSVGGATCSSGVYYQSTNTYSSLDAAIAAMQDPTTTYTKKSSSNSKLGISTESGYEFSATNMPALNFSGDYARARKISKEENIQVIPTA
jgi:hypothetical protein